MSIYIFKKGGNPLNPIFIFDAELSERRTDEVEWTDFPIESQATVTDFGWVKPVVYVVTGIITSSPIGGAFSLERLQRIHRALVEAVAARQLVTLVTETFVEDCVIVRAEASRGRSEGEAFAIEVELKTIERPTVETVRIDASRLRNKRKGRRRMSTKSQLSTSREGKLASERPLSLETQQQNKLDAQDRQARSSIRGTNEKKLEINAAPSF